MKKDWTVALLLACTLLISGCGIQGNIQSGEDGEDFPTQQETIVTDDTAENESGSKLETETESEIETETIVEPVITTFTITATGDCALGALQYHEYANSFHQYYDENGESYFFDKFRDIFAEDDLTLINLECVFSDAEARKAV